MEQSYTHANQVYALDKKKKKSFLSLVLPLFLLILFMGASVVDVKASHFRYGDLSWRIDENDPSGKTIIFRLNTGWRCCPSHFLNFGDGTSASFAANYTGSANGAVYYTGSISHTYANNGSYKVQFRSGNKIGGLQNNANAGWNIFTQVNVGTGNNSPVTSLPAIVNLQQGLSGATFTIPASDPDGNTLSFRLATTADGWPGVNPSGLSINSSTGVVTWNTSSTSIGQLWNAGIIVSDNNGAEVVVDFLMQITQQSNPPSFDYSAGKTPANATTYQASPGQTIAFNLEAFDTDPGSTVAITAAGLPVGATISPAFGATGNPINHAFSWTPIASQFGTYVINFVAQDNNGVQTGTSVSIIVSLKPQFDVPPTPASNVHNYIVAPGTTISYTVQASDPDPADVVTINKVEGKSMTGAHIPLYSGASFSPLPSPSGNPTSGTFTWTPGASDWGHRHVFFTAEDSYGDKAVHEVSQLINTNPLFTSTPVTSVSAGQAYTYNIVVYDPDVAYGDAIDIFANSLPSWATFVDNNNGTASLTGNPGIGDAGTHSVVLIAEDLHHHYYPSQIPQQSFVITVNPCTLALSATNVDETCDASNGSIDLTYTGANLPATISWTGPNSFASTSEDLSGLAAGTYDVTITDAFSCSESLQVVVANEADVTLPTVYTQDITVYLDANGNASISANDVNNGSTDNCGIASMSLNVNSFSCSDIGSQAGAPNNYSADLTHGNDYIVIGNVTPSGNSYTKEAWVKMSSNGCENIVSSNRNPFWIPGKLSAGNNGTYSVVTDPSPFPLNVWTHVAVTYDVATTTMKLYKNGNLVASSTNAPPNSGGTNAIGKHYAGGCNFNGLIDEVRIWNYALPSSNIQANMNITLSGNESGLVAYYPLENGPSGTSAIDYTGNGYPGNFVNTNSSQVWEASSSPVIATTGGNEVILTVIDANGNSASETANVTVEDNIAPVVLTQNLTIQLDASGAATITPQDVDNGSSDNCSINSMSLDITTFDCSDVGTCDPGTALNIAGSSQYGNINGISAPSEFTLEAWVYAYTNSGGWRTLLEFANDAPYFGFENGGYLTLYQSGAKYNTQFPTNQWVHVATTYNSSSTQLYVNGNLVATGSNTINTSGTGMGIGYHAGDNPFNGIIDEVRVWNYKRSQTEVQSTMGTCLSGSENGLVGYWNLNEGSGTSFSDISPNAYSGTLVGGQFWANSNANIGGPGNGGNEVTLSVVDVNGNTASATANVIVEDNINPIAIAQSITIQLDASGNASIVSGDIDNGSNDACGIATYALSQYAFDCYHVGANTVTLTVTDNNGNVNSTTATVTVEDNVDPIAIAKDITVQLDASGNTSIVAADVNNGSNDACGIASLSVFPNAFSCKQVGPNTVTLTVTDVNNNVSTTTSTVTVEDNVDPIALAKNITIDLDASGAASITPLDVDDGSDDACGIASLSVSPNTFGCSNTGTNTVTLTVTDNNGNVSTTTSVVTVEDNMYPTLSCVKTQVRCANIPFDNTYKTDGTEFDLTAMWDNCSISSVTNDQNNSSSLADHVFATGNTLVTWTVVDASGNSTSCSFTLTVNPLPVASIDATGADEWCNGVTLTASGSTFSSGNSFDWSTNETSESIVLSITGSNAGNYSVNVTDPNGCTSPIPAVYDYQPENLAGSYTLIGFKRVKLGENNTVENGSVGVTNAGAQVHLGKNNDVTGVGSFIKADSIVVHPTASFTDTIKERAIITLPTMNYYNISGGTYSAHKVKKNTSKTITGNYVSVKVEEGASVTLTGSVFGTIEIGKGASVHFTSSSIDIIELLIESVARGKKATVASAEVSFAGTTTVRVKSRIDIEGYADVNDANHKVFFYIGENGPNKKPELDIKSDDVNFFGNVYVPDGKIQVHGAPKSSVTTYMTGFFIAESIESNGKNVTWNWYNCYQNNNSNNNNNPRIAGEPIDLVEEGVMSLKAYPNPFTSLANIEFSLPESGRAVVDVYNLLGMKIATLFDGEVEEGSSYTTVFQSEQLSKGVYLIRLTTATESLVERIILAD